MPVVTNMEAGTANNFEHYDDNALIEALSAEELEQLQLEIDPENELLPARDRHKEQTDKKPTGPFDRDHLLEHMKQEALTSEVGKDWIPYEKKTRGKIFTPKPKKEEAPTLLPDELSDVLEGASEEELMELAAVLGINGLLNQKQSQQAEADKVWQSLKGSGLRKYKAGVVKGTKFKQYTDINAINELDLHEAMDKLRNGDTSLTELNLNNHKDVTPVILSEVARELRSNKILKTLYMANCRIGDPLAKEFADALKENTTLEAINLESNFITKDGVTALLQMLRKNTTLKEFKMANQAQTMGHQVEMDVVKTLEQNHSLLRFGFTFDTRGPRHNANKFVIRNNDAERKARVKANEAKANGQ